MTFLRARTRRRHRQILITVTVEDLAVGERWSAARHPLALAASRALGVDVWLTPHGLMRRCGTYWQRWALPVRVARWAAAYAKGDPVGAITFGIARKPKWVKRSLSQVLGSVTGRSPSDDAFHG